MIRKLRKFLKDGDCRPSKDELDDAIDLRALKKPTKNVSSFPWPCMRPVENRVKVLAMCGTNGKNSSPPRGGVGSLQLRPNRIIGLLQQTITWCKIRNAGGLWHQFIHPSGERNCESKVSYPRIQHSDSWQVSSWTQGPTHCVAHPGLSRPVQTSCYQFQNINFLMHHVTAHLRLRWTLEGL